MKKFLLLLCALLGTVGAWATDFTVSNPTQVTDLSTLDAGKFYILQSQGGSQLYNYYDNSTSQMGSKSAYDYSCVVRLINTGGSNYSIQQMSTKTYYQSLTDGTLVSLGSSPVSYTISEQSPSGIYFFDNNGLKLNTNNTGNLPQGANSTWTGAFSQWKIFEVDVQMNATLFNQEVGTFYDFYGTRQAGSKLWNSGSNSGIEGFTLSLTGDNVTFDKAGNWALVVHSSSEETPYTMTLTAPVGYLITGYDLTAQIYSSSYPNTFTLTAENSTSIVINGVSPQTFSVTGLDAQSTNISIVAASASSTTQRWLTMKSLVVKLKPALTPLINVTYALYESDGTTFVSNTVVPQEENSAVSIPAAISSYTYYDYATEGDIGTSDCTIKVTRTLKSGYVISLDGLSNSKCYNIRNNRGTWAVGSGATVVNSTAELNLAFMASDTKQQFAFITYEGNVYLYSVGEGKFAYVDGDKLSLTANVTSAVAASPVTFQASTAPHKDSEPIIVTIGGYMYGVSTGKTPDVFKYNNHPEDDGNCAIIIEAGSFDAASALAALQEYFHPSYTVTYIVKDGSDNVLFTSDAVPTTNGANITTLPAEYQLTNFYEYNTVNVTINASGNTNVEFTATPKAEPLVKYTADTSNPYYYNLNIRSKYLVYNTEAIGEVTLQDTSEPFNANASWAFIGEPYAGFKVINKTKGTDYFLTYTSVVTGGNGGDNGSNNNVQFVASADFNDRYWIVDKNTGGFCLRMKENTNIYFHHQNVKNSTGYLRTCSVSEWGSVHNDAGSTIEASTDEDVLIALYNDMKNLVFASGVGEYSTTYVGTDGAAADIASIGTIIDMKVTAQYPLAYNTLMDIKSKSTLNLPTPSFYRIGGNTSGKYLASGFASNSKFPMTTAKDATTIFYYDGTKLVNFGSGMCNGVTGSGNWTWVTENSASEVTFKDGLTYGGYAIQTGTGHFYDNGDGNPNSADRGGNITDMSTQDTRYRSWKLTEVTTLPVTISSALYATLYAPVALTIPSGVQAYYISSLTATEATLTEIQTTIPANTPVILKAGQADTYNFAITTADAFSGTNMLDGQIAAFAVSAEDVENKVYYTLQKNVAGNAVGLFPKTAAGSIAGFKAYLPAANFPSEGSVKGFTFIFDNGDETGINDIQNGQVIMNGDAIFNLAGQRLNKLQRGVNIVNGKKVLVK